MAIKVIAECDLCQSVMNIEPDDYEPVTWMWRGENLALDVCNECQSNGMLTSSSVSDLVDNSRSHESKQAKFTCNYCKRSFDTAHGLSMHKTRAHKKAGADA